MSFVINGKGYMGMGSPAVNANSRDIWEYNPQTDVWIQQLDFPSSPRNGAVTFTIGDKGYLGTGYIYSGNQVFAVTDFWEYSPCDFEGDAGDPAVFGDNVWNVYAWNGGGEVITNEAWNGSYRGYYVDSSVSINSENMWLHYYTPSYAPGYK